MTAGRLLYESVERFPFWVGVSLALGVASAFMSGISVTMVAPLLLELLGQQLNAQGAPKFLTYIQSFIQSFPPEQRLAFVTAVLVGAIGAKNILLYASNVAFFQLTRLCTEDLRERVLQKLLNANVSYFASSKPGQIVNYAWREVDDSSKVLVAATQLFSVSLTMLVFLGCMLWLSAPLTLASMLVFLAVLPISHMILRRSQELGKLARVNAAKMSAALTEVFVGIRLVKVSGAENREQQRLQTLSRWCSNDAFHTGTTASAVGPATEFSGTVALVTIVLLGKMLIPNTDAGFSAVLVTFLFVLFRLLTQVSIFNGRRAELARWLPSAEGLAAFLDHPDKLPLSNGQLQYKRLSEGVGFQHVSFKYQDDSEQRTLNDIELYIPCKTSLAIVGGSGSGKSTIADLLCRFFDPTEGSITLDGTNLKDFDVASLRSNIGLVSQDTFLFNDTIGYNIRYGRPDASEAEVIEAAKRANAMEFISKLPLGFDSPVGERGALLSAGEGQRIAIARALLNDPDILILDEATSSLDPLAEHQVQSALEQLMQNRTTLIIAHRLATVQRAQQIVVLEQGQIVESGSHEELLRRDGLYRKMCTVGSMPLEQSI